MKMRKLFLAAPLALALYACGDEEVKETDAEKEEVAQQEETEKQEETKKLSVAEKSEWTVDERLQEPTEDTICKMCNMKVYTKDHEQGKFSAQAVSPEGEIVFYDDIGCLLNDEYANNVKNEKFVRDFHTLNWFNVEEAFAVKTDLKSPMNWGYIFFKYEEDANAYIAEHEGAALVAIDEIRKQAAERYDKKHAQKSEGHGEDDGHGHGQAEGDMQQHGDAAEEGNMEHGEATEAGHMEQPAEGTHE